MPAVAFLGLVPRSVYNKSDRAEVDANRNGQAGRSATLRESLSPSGIAKAIKQAGRTRKRTNMSGNESPTRNPIPPHAGEYARDKTRAGQLLTQFIEKAHAHRGVLSQIWEDIVTLYSMLKDWQQGRYPQLPWRALLLSLAGVLYFVNPLDVVPDFIPGLGYVDDMAVLGLLLRGIHKDVLRYQQWRENQTKP